MRMSNRTYSFSIFVLQGPAHSGRTSGASYTTRKSSLCEEIAHQIVHICLKRPEHHAAGPPIARRLQPDLQVAAQIVERALGAGAGGEAKLADDDRFWLMQRAELVDRPAQVGREALAVVPVCRVAPAGVGVV